MVNPVVTEQGRLVSREPVPPTLLKDEIRHRRAIRKAQQAGDVAGELNARKMLRATVQAQTPPAPLEPSPWERFGHGAAQLPAGVAQAATWALGDALPEPLQMPQEEQRAFAEGNQLYREAVPGFDWASMLGEVVGQAPLGAVPGVGPPGLIGRTLMGAGTEAATGAAMFGTLGERAQNALLGGGGGAVGTLALPALASATKWGTSLVPQRLPPDQAARAARMRDFGYEPTRGQVTRDPIIWGDERNLAKQEGAENLMGRFRAQHDRDVTNLAELQERYGGPRDPADAGETVRGAVQQRSREWQSQVREKYDVARAERPDLTLPGNTLAMKTADVFDDFDLPAAVRSRIEGLVDKPGGIEPNDLEKLDKTLTANMGVNNAQDEAMRRLKVSVREMVDEAGDRYGGAYRDAVQEARRRFDALGETRSLVNRLDRGQLDPLKAIPTIRSAGIDELRALRDFVSEDNPQAWQALRAALATDLATKSTPSGNFSQAAYNNYVQRLGPERLRVLFGDEGAREIMEFGGVVRDLYAAPRMHTMNTSNTNVAARRGLDGLLRRVMGYGMLGGMADTFLENAGKRANARATALALDPTKRASDLDPQGKLAGGARALGALAGGAIGRDLFQ